MAWVGWGGPNGVFGRVAHQHAPKPAAHSSKDEVSGKRSTSMDLVRPWAWDENSSCRSSRRPHT